MSTRKQWLLYGATGYSGSHIAEKAVAKGFRPVIAGRREAETRAVAERLGLEWRVVDLGDQAALNALVREFSTVMHAAGPFINTYEPMIKACLAGGTHYLDITGEIPVFEGLAAFDTEARKAGIMMMPGCGFDMVPGDCLALYLKRQMPDTTRFDIAVSFEGTLTHGTILSTLANTNPLPHVRRNHKLTHLPQPIGREVDFGPGRCGGLATAYSATFGDASTAWRTTGIPDITAWLRPAPEFAALANIKSAADVASLPAGPSKEELDTIPTIFVAQVGNDAGESRAVRLVTPQIYAITFDAAATIAQFVHEGTFRAGFQTPAGVFGEDFILEFDGCRREDWQPGALPAE